MADTVLSYVRKGPGRFFLVVAGNIHPRTAKGLPWDKDYRPMGMLIAEQVEDTIALDMAYNSGTAWICAAGPKGERLECGVKEAKGKDNGDRALRAPLGRLGRATASTASSTWGR